MTVSQPNTNDEHDPDLDNKNIFKRHYLIAFLTKLFGVLLFLFFLLCLALYVAAGTSGGTKFLVEKIISETGVKLEYGDGNLRDGLLVTDVALSATDKIDVHFVNAKVKLGWRAIFARQIHLREAHIELIEITNLNPPTDEPFEYKTLELPLNLHFDDAKIDSIKYNQISKDPVTVTNIAAKDLSWVGTKVAVDSANLQYNDLVKINNLNGFIKLQNNYPLDLGATITVFSLEDVYIDPIAVKATGSLKRTYGTVQGKYNNSDVTGEFTVQGLDKNAPFDAKLKWDEINLPYLESQHITLNDGLAVASGVVSDIELRINSQLQADNVPSGQYRGRAVIADSKMRIERLNANSPDGDLLLQGVLDWQQDFSAKVMLLGANYELRTLLPDTVAPYAPQNFDGQLAVVYEHKNADGLMQINADLNQNDGEHINAKVVRGVEPSNPRFDAPWMIDATWQNIVRHNLPQIGNLDSPNGKVNLKIRDNRLWVTANANIVTLNAAPQGAYQLKASKINNLIKLSSFQYNGSMGNLSGKGSAKLADNKNPLTWQITANTTNLLPQEFKADLPVNRLIGKVNASGKLYEINKTVTGKKLKGQRHTFTIYNTDLTATVDANDSASTNRSIKLTGKGSGSVDLIAGDLTQFSAKYDGRIGTQQVPEGRFIIDAAGNPNDIEINAFKYTGEAGYLLATGNVGLKDKVTWQVTAEAKQLNIAYLMPQTDGEITGRLITSGEWKPNETKLGDLKAFKVNFNGALNTSTLPKGKLTLEAGGTANSINIKKFSHEGAAGKLSATGTVEVNQGIKWTVDAAMNQFNVGYFINDLPSALTGRVSTQGLWSDTEQRININKLRLNGTLKNQPIKAQGKLETILHLPQNLNDYLNIVKHSDTKHQVDQFHSIVQTLKADNLLLQIGDNQIIANGNKQRLQAKLSLKNLHQVADKLRGNIKGGLILVQPKNKALPTVYVDITADNIKLPSLAVSKTSLKGKVVDFGKSPSQLAVVVNDLDMASTKFSDVTLNLSGTEQAHIANFKAKTLSIDDNAHVKGTIKGGLNRQNSSWRGVIGNGEVATKYVALRQTQPAQLVVKFSNGSTQISLAKHCWQANDESGTLCLKDNFEASSTQGKLDLAIQQIDTTLLTPFMPQDLSWRAKVNGRALVGWKKGQKPLIDAALYSDNGKIGMLQDGGSQAVTMPYKRVSLIAKSSKGGLKVRTDINSGQGARGYADIVIDPYKQSKPIAGALVLNEFNLAILKPFFPGIRRLQGGITMAGGVGGTLTSPVFYGDVNLKDASIAIIDLPVNLTNINAKAKIRGQSAKLDGEFMSGEGSGKLSGTIDWQNQLQAKLRIQGKRLVISQPPLLFAEINPDFNVIVKPSQQYVNIVGAISVPNATIRPPEANSAVISKSDDVVVLDRRLVGNIDEVLAISKPWSINADIGIDLGDDVYFRGFGAALPLAGAIHVTQKGQGDMQATGVIQVSRRGNVDAFGQSLELNYAQVRFNGDVKNPKLSIEAVQDIEGQTVGLRVKNTVSNPNIVVFNDAGLTQQQAMNALVTGRISGRGATQISEQGFKSEVTNTLAAAGLSLGLSSTRSLTNSIGKAIGLQSLTLNASGNGSSTNVNITGYITPDLYIRYGVGVFNAQSTLSLRYQLTRRFYIEATSAAESAVDVVYSFEF